MSAAITAATRAAIRAWVVAATSGLGVTDVIWADQRGPRLAAPYLTLKLGLRRVGQDWLEVRDNEFSDGEDGEEIQHRQRGVREGALTLTCYGSADGVEPTAASPEAVLDAAQSGVRLPTAAAALRAANVGVLDFGPVGGPSGTLGGLLEPRAVLVARLSLSSEVSELGTYIESVEITDEGATP